MTTEAPAPVAADPRPKCPSCGADAERSQPFCLECGRRLALDYRRPPSFRLPLIVVAVIVIAGGVLAGYAVTRATDDKRGPDAITVNDVPDPGLAARQKEQQRQAQQQQQAQAQQQSPSTAAPGWPKGTTAYTVVLLATKDRGTANATAQKSIADGIDAGVLRASRFQGLGSNLYVVFSGRYGTAGKAQARAQLLAGAGHPGAYARRIKPKP